MGFVGCAFVMYLLWWNKPFDVEQSIPIDCSLKDHERVKKRIREKFEARYVDEVVSPQWNDFLRERRIPNWAYLDEGSLGLGTLR